MSLEQYPVKEKLATDLESQLAWLVREMGYSRDKTKGYEEKLIRLTRSPDDAQSVFGFMSNYWHRFRQANDVLPQYPVQLAVDRALQAYAKVVAGVADKIAFSLWLESKLVNQPRDSEWLLDNALLSLKEKAEALEGSFTNEELASFNNYPFEANPMGQAILKLHDAYAHSPQDTHALHSIAVEGAASGVLMWRAYAQSLAEQGFSAVMPKPGLSSGNIEPWE